MNPYPDWLNPGDNAWQLVAATLVGLMSIPGIAVLYGGIVQKKWAVNTMLMAFTGFSLVLVVWVLWGFKMGFGDPIQARPGHPGFLRRPPRARSILAHRQPGSGGHPTTRRCNAQISVLREHAGVLPIRVRRDHSPLLFLGSVVGRMNFKVWLIFVPLWSTFAYSINAFLVWSGGFWGQAHAGASSLFSTGALDYSGGYVIHLAAGVSGFVAAAVIGPRLNRDRERAVPNNLPHCRCRSGQPVAGLERLQRAVTPTSPVPTRRWPCSTPTSRPQWHC